MKHLIILCSVNDVKFENISTSSSRYELQFVNCMSRGFDVTSVVSPQITSNIDCGNITFYACDDGDLLFNIDPIIKKVKKLLYPKEQTVILFWGYNPIVIHKLCQFKSKNVKVVSMIYDTHLGSMQGKRMLSKFMLHLFYTMGIMQVNRLDAVILFKKRAAQRLHLRKPYMVTLPIIRPEEISPYRDRERQEIVFLYAGTLTQYNGIVELVEGFKKLKKDNVCLKIYGDGPLADYVKQESKADMRVFYGGRIVNSELSKEIKKADVLLNFRAVPSVINDFAFPSKVVEYMSYGKVVMSSNVSEHREFIDSVFLVHEFTSTDITNTMEYVCTHQEEFNSKVNKSAEYLNRYHNYDMCFNTFMGFINKLFK